MEFQSFPKIQRYERGMAVITEKIDGSNGCLIFNDEGDMWVQSRNRMLTLDKQNDNFGFAHWAHNTEGLFEFFGPGRHYGEWFGCGIQRGYGMSERCFAPFNTGLFSQERIEAGAPDGVTYTPVLGVCQLTELNETVDQVMGVLSTDGSHTREGWGWAPEGSMIWSPQFDYLKVPFELAHKWELSAEVAA